MKTIINGEAPFQVLTQNFSIGPADAYTLQISADGVNYSDLFSVGADVTRMVSDVAAGSFYRLAGNGRDGVVINWMKSCGEGGGSGEAGVASLNGQKGNLTLKTINGNDLLGGGNIEIEGGSSDILKARTEFPSEAEDGDVVAIKGGENGVYQYVVDGEGTKWLRLNLALDYFREQMDAEGVDRWVFHIANTNEPALSTDRWTWQLGPDKNSKTWVLGNEIGGDEFVYLYDNVRAKMGDDMLILDVIYDDWQYIDPYNQAVEDSEEIIESGEVRKWKPVGNGGGVQSDEISKIKVLTQDEYEALEDKDMGTLYIIKD